MDASGPGASPFDKADIVVLAFVYLRPLAWQNQSQPSVSYRLIFDKCILHHRPFSLARFNASSMSVPLASPTNLSFISVIVNYFQPSPISPSRCESGILTLSKYTSLKPAPDPAVPVICLIGFTVIPGDFISTKKN